MPETYQDCPKCGVAATFSSYDKKYVCRGEQHGRYPYRFAGDSGYCSEMDCKNKATVVEPEFRAQFNYGNSTITYDRLNTPRYSYDSKESIAGQQFCGIHSPSRKAERDAKKSKERHDERAYIQQAQHARLDRDAAYITQLVANLQEQPLTEGQLTALNELERLARKTIGKGF